MRSTRVSIIVTEAARTCPCARSLPRMLLVHIVRGTLTFHYETYAMLERQSQERSQTRREHLYWDDHPMGDRTRRSDKIGGQRVRPDINGQQAPDHDDVGRRGSRAIVSDCGSSVRGDAAHHGRLDRVHQHANAGIADEALPTGEDHCGGRVPLSERVMTPQASPKRT